MKDPNYFLVYSPEIYQIILDYIAAGNYPYNRDIENLVQLKLFPEVSHSEENRTFSLIVYNTQSYHHAIEDEKKEARFIEQMNELGFIQATPEMLNEAADTKKRFHVVLKGITFLGDEVKSIYDQKLKVVNTEAGLLWMKLTASRKGWLASPGQYIKEIKAIK
jgi:hypothetical protein